MYCYVDGESVLAFLHAHAERIVEILKPKDGGDPIAYGSSIDGYTEAELRGHVNSMALYSNLLAQMELNLLTKKPE